MSEACLIRAAQTGTRRPALNSLDACTPLIRSLSRHYSTRRTGQRELVQVGAVGLLRALERYDAELGTPFRAYASWWVRHAMQASTPAD